MQGCARDFLRGSRQILFCMDERRVDFLNLVASARAEGDLSSLNRVDTLSLAALLLLQ